MDVFWTGLEWPRFGCALTLSLLISFYGWKKRSLSLSGSVAAIVVGFVLTAASACFCVSLLTFFFTSSRLTKWRSTEKKNLEEEFKEGGQRDWIQVLCNGGVATVAALLYVRGTGYGEHVPSSIHNHCQPSPFTPTIFSIACLASLACCCGDTWASEVGSVIGGTPRLITSWRTVPRGTNGGVTLIGTLCSIAGGLVVGVAYWITASFVVLLSSHSSFSYNISVLSLYPYAIIGAVAGLLGSLIDSLLGATIQYSGYSEKLDQIVSTPGDGVRHISGLNVVNNHTVNFLSSLVTAVAVPALVCAISF